MVALPNEKPTIPGSTFRMVLEGMQALSGAQFEHLLRKAGLERFVRALPVATAVPVVSEAEVSRLYAALNEMMGETLTRSFLASYGKQIAPHMLKGPRAVALLAKAPAVEPAQRLGWAVAGLAELITQTWTETRVREDATAYYVDVPHCPVCASVRGTQGPFCASSEALFTAIVRELSGKRVTLLEVACRAQGAAACSYRVLK